MRSLQYRPLREESNNKKEEAPTVSPEETPAQAPADSDVFDESVVIS